MPDTRKSASELEREILALRREVAREGRALWSGWRPSIDRPVFAASALNLAHYLILRRHDLRAVQRRLMPLGLSSLGRAEGRVLAALDAVSAALAAIAGGEPLAWPSERRFFRGERTLQANTTELFGPAAATGRRGRIMATLGSDAATDPAILAALVGRGVEVVRINCAHDGPAEWQAMIDNLRKAETVAGRRVRVLFDIAGPKVRTGSVVVPPHRSRLCIGDELLLRKEASPGPVSYPFQATCSLPAVFDLLKVGDTVSLDDGKLRGSVVRRVDGDAVVHIDQGRLKGVKLRPGKGLNFPSLDLPLEPLTAKDIADLDCVAKDADMIGLSFVHDAAHVRSLQAEIKARRAADWERVGIVVKIETPRAVTNLPAIMVEAAGRQPLAVMIARGDLAVEIGFERLAEMQEEILWLCEAAHVPAIWATQVLEGLVTKGLPSRGEMTDAAMAGRAEVVMLNKGPNVAAAVDILSSLLGRMDAHQLKKTPTLRALHSWQPGAGVPSR
jgi:pyruvate kinase